MVHATEIQTVDMEDLWGLDRIDQHGYPLNKQYEYLFDGSEIEVYVADSGIYASHEQFRGRNIECVHDAINERNYPNCLDGDSHGTHVSGTIAGRTTGECSTPAKFLLSNYKPISYYTDSFSFFFF